MQKSILCPKDYIRNKQSFQDYQCNICYQICVRPAVCLGTCRRIFCLKCVSQSRMANDKCPMRCSSPFQVKVLPQLNIQFNCPYGAEQCTVSICSLQQFNEHYKKCKYVPEEQVRAKLLKKQFRCLKSHQLQFFVGSFQEMCNSHCSLCNQIKLCRAICRQCDNQLYCVQCRTPPCEKGKCPMGHQMKLWKSSNLAYICDICGISTAVSDKNVYDDTECNFGICEECFANITKKQQDDIPKIKLQTNKHDQCDKGHKLQISESLEMLSDCSRCKKTKECVKQCKQCNKTYCLSCKIAVIQGDQTCPKNHQFIQICAETIASEQNLSFKCMKCQTQSSLVFYDKICRIKLCQKCFIYGITLASQKQRFIEIITCKKNHILRYMNNPQNEQGYCTSCRRKVIAKLYCDFCQRNDQVYCCSCKPLSKFEKCYFGHPLLNDVVPQNQSCVLCSKKQEKMVGCKKCLFYICRNCQDQYDDKLYDRLVVREQPVIMKQQREW